MSDPHPEQLAIDVDALPQDHLQGGAPADHEAFERARREFYAAHMPIDPFCLPDHGVHVFADPDGKGPCLCKTATKKGTT